MSDAAILDAFDGATPTFGLPDQVAPPVPPPAANTLIETGLEVTESTASRGGTSGLEPWASGFLFEPESCGQGVVWSACDPQHPVKDIGNTPTGRGHIPMVIVGGWRCNTTAWQVKDYKGHATRNLEAISSPQLEQELWTGAQAAKTPVAAQLNMSLQSPDPTNPGAGVVILSGNLATPAAVSPRAALSLLQQGIANCGVGGLGMIHATPYLAELWAGGHMAKSIEYNDDEYRMMLGADIQAELATAGKLPQPGTGHTVRRHRVLSTLTRGTLIIAGAGYPGTGPATAGHMTPETNHVWAFGTSVVNYRLGKIRTYPDSETMGRDLSEGTNRQSNTVEYRAERKAAAVFDPCCVVAVYIDLTLGQN